MATLLRWMSSTQAFHEGLGDGQTLTLLRIPAGRFRMGSPDQEAGRDPDEGPLHEVELQEFLMASTPITQAQWRAVARWQPGPEKPWQIPLPEDPALFQGKQANLGDGESDTSQHPVEQITWEEAMEFCRRLSQRSRRRYSLPSEAQWEYACRAGSSSAYAFGSALTAELATLRFPGAAVVDPRAMASPQTTPVQRHPANAWGLHDMHGNVWEWCLDHWHASYAGAPSDGSAWLDGNAPVGADRVVRGGAWSDPPSDARSACRYRLPAQAREPAIVGLRVVCVPGSPGAEISRPSDDQPARPLPGHQPKVVWVDDHHANNRAERAALEAEGVQILLASSPGEAIELLDPASPATSVDLLLSDLRQGEDPEAGLELLTMLRANQLNLPVVFYVGELSDDRNRKAMEAGALAVIHQRDQLLEIVRSLLAQKPGQ